VFERFIARQFLKDNLTLFGYDLRFRPEESGVGEVSRSSAPYLVDASTMVFHWETLTGNAPAFVSLTAAAIPIVAHSQKFRLFRRRDPGLFCGGEHAREGAHVWIAAATSETKNNTEQAPRRRRLNRASGNDSCVLADSGFPFAG
jgi:hypothetical protein